MWQEIEIPTVEQQIIEDYVGSILRRLCRRTFGSLPTCRRTYQQRGSQLIYSYQIKRWSGKRRAQIILNFLFPKVIIECWGAGKLHTKTISVADPKSFDKINKFLNEIFQKNKKVCGFADFTDPPRDIRPLPPSKIGLKKRPKKKKRRLKRS